MSAFAPSALGSGPACRIRFYDEIDKSINKLQIVQTVQNWWKTDRKLLKHEEIMRTDEQEMNNRFWKGNKSIP